MYTEFSHYLLFLTIFAVIMFFCLQKHYVFSIKHQHRSIFWLISFYFFIFTSCFYCAIMSYACSDYSFYNILTNSPGGPEGPIFYKISATWSNHEGSLLLWCWLLSVCGFIFSVITRSTNRESRRAKWNASRVGIIIRADQFDILPIHNYKEEQRRCVAIKSAMFFTIIILFFATFLVYTSNPFLKIPFPSLYSVAELNPVLQDPILAIHPPCIYAGYVASALGFSLCLSIIEATKCGHWRATVGSLNRSIRLPKIKLSFTPPFSHDRKWIFRIVTDRHFRIVTDRHKCPTAAEPSVPILTDPDIKCPVLLGHSGSHFEHRGYNVQLWILACWSFLTLGIMLGSWWAYHELGWGGWWFWDPVENASLMPWLLVTASLHIVSKEKFALTTCSLTLGAFILSILGTFFVRSGLLTSVHSFATDSTRGIYLLVFLLYIFVISLRSMYQFKTKQNNHVVSRCNTDASGYRIRYSNTQRSFLNWWEFLKKTSRSGAPKATTELEQLLFIQSLFFCIICVVVLCGTCTPIVFQFFFNRDVSTGTSFYNSTLIPLFTSLFFGLVYMHYPSDPSLRNGLSWRILFEATQWGLLLRSLPSRIWEWFQIRRHRRGVPTSRNAEFSVFSIILFASSQFFCLIWLGFSFLESLYGALCILLISCFFLVKHTWVLFGYDKAKVPNFQPSRLVNSTAEPAIRRSTSWPMMLAHIGVVIFIAGIILSSGSLKVQFTQLLKYGDLVRIDSHICSLRGIDHSYAPSYHSICGNLIIYKENAALPVQLSGLSSRHFFSDEPPSSTYGYYLRSIQDNINDSFCLFPEKRFFYSNPQLNITKVAIHTNLFTDFYGLIGTGSAQSASDSCGWYTTLMKLPFIFCIWLGFFFGSLGGVFALKRQLQKYKLKWL